VINAANIGKRIKKLRKERGLSQERMAEDLGMYQADISNLERAVGGSGISDLYKLDMIADYFGVPLVEILVGSEDSSDDLQIQGLYVNPLPRKDADEPYDMNDSELSVLYGFRYMVETDLKSQCSVSDAENTMLREKQILEKLKAACPSEEAYELWKKYKK
jgi:transcriptional regulator with XRE-family HTH domain